MIDQKAIQAAEKDLGELHDTWAKWVPENGSHAHTMLQAVGTALACLRECAERRERAADVAPVVHGEWESGCSNGMGTEYCYCSKCSEDALKDKSGYTEFSTFCPNCGAKMDGGI
jgi:hypothetical protein